MPDKIGDDSGIDVIQAGDQGDGRVTGDDGFIEGIRLRLRNEGACGPEITRERLSPRGFSAGMSQSRIQKWSFIICTRTASALASFRTAVRVSIAGNSQRSVFECFRAGLSGLRPNIVFISRTCESSYLQVGPFVRLERGDLGSREFRTGRSTGDGPM